MIESQKVNYDEIQANAVKHVTAFKDGVFDDPNPFTDMCNRINKYLHVDKPVRHNDLRYKITGLHDRYAIAEERTKSDYHERMTLRYTFDHVLNTMLSLNMVKRETSGLVPSGNNSDI